MSSRMRVGLLLGDRPDLLDAVAHADGVHVAAVACNSGATAARAARLAPARAFPVEDHVDREERDTAIAGFLAGHGAQLIVTAGWLWLLGPAFLDAFRYLAVNVHPTLLPAFPGRRSVERAVQAGAHRHGATIHFIDDGIDTGAPISEAALRPP